jgi:hypothetical protein
MYNVMRHGDPLATFRTSGRKLGRESETHDDYDYRDGSYSHMEEMCPYCKDRLSEGLLELCRTLFNMHMHMLPSFFHTLTSVTF